MNKIRIKFLNKKPAAILIMTLLFLTGIIFLIQQFTKQVAIYYRFSNIIVAKEQSKMIAMGGVNLAIAQFLGSPKIKSKKSSLTEANESEEDKASQDKTLQTQEADNKEFLERVLPHMNRWQVFKLNEKLEGIDGEVRFCIISEEGKINLNEIFDFEKKELKKDYIYLLDKIKFNNKTLEKLEISKVLSDFFKKRGKKLDDVAQLHSIPELKDIPLFYEPPRTNLKKGETEYRNDSLYDLFTIWSEKSTLDVLFLSDSLCDVLKIRRPTFNDSIIMKQKFKQVIKEFKANIGSNVLQNWSILQHIYDKKPSDLEKLQRLFSQKFDPRVYTVLSSGTVRGIEQKLMAIIRYNDSENETLQPSLPSEKEEVKDKKELEEKNKTKNKSQNKNSSFDIIRFYWL